MSGGTWSYQQWHAIQDLVDVFQTNQVLLVKLLNAVGESEHIVDWAEAGDTVRSGAERDLYELWLKTFNEVFGEY